MLAFGLTACGSSGDDDGGGGGGDDTDCYDDPSACVGAGTDHQFVLDTLTLPATASQAQQLGLDLDGDPQNRPDNALGQILSTLAAQGDIGLQDSVDTSVNNGGIVILFNLRASVLTTATDVGGWVYLGDNPSPTACTDEADPTTCGQHLLGDASFDIASSSPTDAVIAGQLVGGQATLGPGQVTIQLDLGDVAPPITLNLIGARATMSVTETGLSNGKLGGAVTESELNDNILPAIVDIMVEAIGEDCPNQAAPCCVEGSTGETLIDLFDDDDSCTITLDELRSNDLISSLLAPDVDLLDENGNYAPRTDGVKDSLSLGVGFTGVGATFTLPPQ